MLNVIREEDCVVVTKMFQDDIIENCIITIDFSYYLTNDGTLIYKFNRTVVSYPGLYAVVDFCLQIDGEQVTTEGQCNSLKPKNQQTILNTLSNCQSKEDSASFVIHYSDNDFTFNVTELHSSCSNHCELLSTSPQIASIDFYGGNRLSSATPATGLCTRSFHPFVTTSSPPPVVVAPTLPSEVDNCTATPIEHIYCQLLKDTTNVTAIEEAIETTKKVLFRTDNITTFDIYYAGAAIVQALANLEKINPNTTNNILDIIGRAAVERIELLSKSNMDDSILWFPGAIPDLIAKAEHYIEYEHNAGGLFIKSLNKNELCTSEEEDYEICFKDSQKVEKKSEDVTMCLVIPIKDTLCKSRKKWFISITPIKFYTLGNNTVDGETVMFKTSDTEINHDAPSNDSDGCHHQSAPTSRNVAGVSAVNKKGEIETISFKLIVYHSKKVNDLHRKVKVAYFTGQNFWQGGEAIRFSDRYEQQCNFSNCVIYYDGYLNDPITCSTLFKVIVSFVSAGSSVFILFSVTAYIAKRGHGPLPCILRCLPPLLYKFDDNHLNTKAQWFSAIYNGTFFVFLVMLILIGNISMLSVSRVPCAIITGFSYYFYLVCIVLSIVKVFIVTDAMGNWKTNYGIFVRIFAGRDQLIIWPLIHCFVWPMIIVLIYGLTANEVFQRNDHLCWIRSDHYIGALWFPLTILSLTIPLYIPLVSRCWPRVLLFRWINKFYVNDLTQLKTSGEWEREFRALQRINIAASTTMPYPASRICTCLLVPQILLGLPVIFESATLYITYLSVWHILFIVILVCHLFIYLVVSIIIYIICKRNRDTETQSPVNEPEDVEQFRSASQSDSNRTMSDSILTYRMTTQVTCNMEIPTIVIEDDGSYRNAPREPIVDAIGTVINERTGSIVGYIRRASDDPNTIFFYCRSETSNSSNYHEFSPRALSRLSNSMSSISTFSRNININ